MTSREEYRAMHARLERRARRRRAAGVVARRPCRECGSLCLSEVCCECRRVAEHRLGRRNHGEMVRQRMDDPGREDRIAEYARRAAAHLPLFETRVIDAPPSI